LFPLPVFSGGMGRVSWCQPQDFCWQKKFSFLLVSWGRRKAGMLRDASWREPTWDWSQYRWSERYWGLITLFWHLDQPFSFGPTNPPFA
jgi:hypothetical protein